MHVVALLAAFNEERFVGGCIEHLIEHGCEVFLLDNDSTDGTVAIAEGYLGRGLRGIERVPRDGVFRWRELLRRKEELAATLDGDWFVHLDPDEIRLPPRSGVTLARALEEVDASGYNAVNFLEFTFVPTQEEPDHDHPEFRRTMRSYYPFLPKYPSQVNAWRRQPGRVDLANSAGHEVRFPGLRLCPESFRMRHYMYLSVAHAIGKYVHRAYDPSAIARGWHGLRSRLEPESIRLPRSADLRRYHSDDELDPSEPLERHLLFEQMDLDGSGWRRVAKRIFGSLLRRSPQRREAAPLERGK